MRVFYAQFYWCQKAGEAFTTILILIYLSMWMSFVTLPKDQQATYINTDAPQYLVLFFTWVASIVLAFVISLFSLSFGRSSFLHLYVSVCLSSVVSPQVSICVAMYVLSLCVSVCLSLVLHVSLQVYVCLDWLCIISAHLCTS